MTTVNNKEVEKFTKMANEWWDKSGKFKPLHKFNPIRIGFLKRKINEYFKLMDSRLRENDRREGKNDGELEFEKLKILDIGCGGGLISEIFASLGANVTGIDAGRENIEVAKTHAEKSNLNITYKNITAEKLLETKEEQFDVVFALEIIEHVDNVDQFIESCSKLVKKDGLIFIATMNRNVKSLLTAKIIAEYVLRWLPRGTHDWKKFLKPSEINEFAVKNNLRLEEISGFEYNLLSDSWKESKNLDVNYMMVFVKE